MQDKLGWLWFQQLHYEGLSFLNPKELCYSHPWYRSLSEGGTSIWAGLCVEISEDSYLYFWLALLHLLPYIFFLSTPSLFIWANFSTWIPDCDTQNFALVDLFTSFNSSICSTVAFCQLKILISFNWLSIKLKRKCLFLSHGLRLFSCWLGQSSWSYKRYL